jgi:hypothetical protein
MTEPAYRLLGVTYYLGQTKLKAHVLVVAKKAVAQIEFTWMSRDDSPIPPAGWAEQVLAEAANAAQTSVSDPFAKFYR